LCPRHAAKQCTDQEAEHEAAKYLTDAQPLYKRS